jgi:phi LC3 family holin
MNIKLRAKNFTFWVSIVLAIFAPIIAYAGISYSDITSWSVVIQLIKEAILNPYILAVIIVSIYNTVIDPTTAGIPDNSRVRAASSTEDLK